MYAAKNGRHPRLQHIPPHNLYNQGLSREDPLARTYIGIPFRPYTITPSALHNYILGTWENIPGTLEKRVSGDLDGNGTNDLAGINSLGSIFLLLLEDVSLDVNLTVSEILMSQGVDIGLDPKLDLGAVTVPRIAGRDTVVRALVEISGDSDLVSSVSAKLHGEHEGVPLPGSPLEATLSSVPDLPSTATWKHSLNFPLPDAWATAAAAFYLELDSENEYAESNEFDNRVPASGTLEFEFVETPDFDLMIVPVIHNGLTPDPAGYSLIENWIRWLYPVPNLNVTVHSTVTYPGPPVEPNGTNWANVLDFVTSIRNAETSRPDLYYYGVFDPGYTSGVTGLGWIPSSPSWPYPIAIGSDYTEYTGDTAAHEIGHNHGRNHVAGCDTPSNVDPNYPYPNGEIGVVGWQIGSTTLYDSSTYRDVMSYCDSLWVSDYNYRAFYDWDASLSSNERLTEQFAVERVFCLSGAIREGKVVDVRAFDLLDHSETPDEGDYLLELLDARGRVVASKWFAAVPTDHVPDRYGFVVKVDDTHLQISGYRILGPQGQYLAEEHRVGSLPKVEISRVTRTAPGMTAMELREESDYELLRVVMVATTSGDRWEVRFLGKTRKSLEWMDLIVAPGENRVRVIVSDGVRSAIVETDLRAW